MFTVRRGHLTRVYLTLQSGPDESLSAHRQRCEQLRALLCARGGRAAWHCEPQAPYESERRSTAGATLQAQQTPTYLPRCDSLGGSDGGWRSTGLRVI